MKDLIKTNILLILAVAILILTFIIIRIDRVDARVEQQRDSKVELNNVRSKAQILSDISAYARGREVTERSALKRTKSDYEAHRTTMLDKLDNNLNDKVPMTPQEWQQVVEVLNYEITK